MSWSKGSHHSPESIQKIRDALRGRPQGSHSRKTKARISAAKKGVPNIKLRGRKLSAETREKLAAIMRGRKLSPEHRSAIAAARKGLPSPFKGKIHSAATKAKISQSLKARRKE